ncbi:MAG: diguanylate cyclase [Nitrospirota bacterium]
MDKKELRILILEDVAADAELMEHELRKAGMQFSLRRVWTKETFLKEIRDFSPDIILADYALPQFDGLSALTIAKEKCPDVPFILVSGVIGEESLIEVIKSGATDFVFKQRLSRLAISVPRALHEAEERAERKRAEEALSWELRVNTVIAELSSALLAEQSLSIDDISYLVLEQARRLTKSVFGYVGYIDPATGYLILPTLTREIWDECKVKDKGIVFKKFKGLWGWVLNNHKPLMTNTPSDDPRSSGIPTGHLPIYRFLSAPALIGDKLFGQISVANSEHDYIDRDLNFITRLASLYGIALQRKRMEEKLLYVGTHDTLTGLYNRTYFEEETNRLERGRQFPISILMVDVNGLKAVNDSQGHGAGDELLRRTAQILLISVRVEDMVARIGGDEFAVLLTGTGISAAEKAVERVRKNLKAHNCKYNRPPLSLSLGVATGEKGSSLDEVLKEADKNMYQDKLSRNNKARKNTP